MQVIISGMLLHQIANLCSDINFCISFTQPTFFFIDNMLHYKVILHVPFVTVMRYIFIFRICVTL